MNKVTIDTLIFDVGGVLINEYPKTGKDVLERVQLDPQVFHETWSKIVPRFGSGKMSEADVWRELETVGAPHVEVDENVLGKPYAEQLTIYQDVLDAVKNLSQKGYRLAILSNTIDAHSDILRRTDVYTTFGQNVYLSQEIGIRKPDIEAYMYVIEHVGIEDTSHAIFFDDRAENLLPAAQLGMQTFLVENTESLLDVLNNLEV